MSNEKMGVGMSSSSTATRKSEPNKVGLGLFDVFHVECYSADGKLKWVDEVHNAITNEGIEYAMDCIFYGGTQYTEGAAGNWYIGLVDINPTDNTYGDSATTITTSVMGVAEYTEYDEAARPALDLAAAGTASGGSVTNQNTTPASFTISSPGTDVGGCFIVAGSGTTGNVKGANVAGGVLYGAGPFQAGNKTVDTGDTLNVTVQVSAASA